jgi:hypothetical protein
MEELSVDVEGRLATFLFTSLLAREILWTELTEEGDKMVSEAASQGRSV